MKQAIDIILLYVFNDVPTFQFMRSQLNVYKVMFLFFGESTDAGISLGMNNVIKKNKNKCNKMIQALKCLTSSQ